MIVCHVYIKKINQLIEQSRAEREREKERVIDSYICCNIIITYVIR